MSEIRVVTFDLWQTLVLDTREWRRERTRICIEDTTALLTKAGESFTEDQVREGFRAANRICRALREQGLDMAFRDQVQTFVKSIGEGLQDRLSREQFAGILNRYADCFYDAPPKIADNAEPVLLALTQAGYRLALISNTAATPGRTLNAYLGEMGLSPYFELYTFSDEVLMCKPNRNIFLHTLLQMGVKPAQAVHVGDHLRNDILGANEVGMRSILLEGPDETGLDVQPTARIKALAELPEALEQLKKL